MKLFRMQALLTLAVLCAADSAQANWVTLDFPGAFVTYAYGIDGDNIVGRRIVLSGGPIYSEVDKGFLYDGSTWRTFGSIVGIVEPASIDGAKIVGSRGTPNGFIVPPVYDWTGFLYDGAAWTTFEFPGAEDTWGEDIDGDNVVGAYRPYPDNVSGFLYDGVTWTPLDFPGAVYTNACGIDGDNIVGHYGDASDNTHGFLYDGVTWTPLDFPAAVHTSADGIDGDNIVGYYRDASENSHGFLYDGTSWIRLDFPGAISTYAKGIDADKIVGYYWDGSTAHGFIYTIPEPATVLLLGLGGLALVRRRRVR